MPQHFMLTLMMSNYGHEAPSLLPTGDRTHGFFKSKISTAGPAKLCVHSIAQRVASLCSVDPETSSSESYTSCNPMRNIADLQRKIADELDRTP
ncbi:unnamed protein product [Musa hybrid cultivar]